MEIGKVYDNGKLGMVLVSGVKGREIEVYSVVTGTTQTVEFDENGCCKFGKFSEVGDGNYSFGKFGDGMPQVMSGLEKVVRQLEKLK